MLVAVATIQTAISATPIGIAMLEPINNVAKLEAVSYSLFNLSGDRDS